jgi:ATP synthase protein I
MAAPDGRSGKGVGAVSDAELARRMDRLTRELDAESRERAAAMPSDRKAGAGYAQAVKLGSEFVAGVLVGAALGWGLDRAAGTSPWGLIVLLLLGFCAGVLNVVRATGRMTAADAGRSGKGGGSP